MDKIINEVREYIENETYTSSDQIKNSSLIFAEGFFDSMGFVRLISFLEEKFSISISDDDLLEENFESIQAISKFIQSKQN